MKLSETDRGQIQELADSIVSMTVCAAALGRSELATELGKAWGILAGILEPMSLSASTVENAPPSSTPSSAESKPAPKCKRCGGDGALGFRRAIGRKLETKWATCPECKGER